MEKSLAATKIKRKEEFLVEIFYCLSKASLENFLKIMSSYISSEDFEINTKSIKNSNQ